MGVVEAARHHGVPKATVSNWRGRDTRPAVQASRTTKRSKASRDVNEATDTERSSSPSSNLRRRLGFLNSSRRTPAVTIDATDDDATDDDAVEPPTSNAA